MRFPRLRLSLAALLVLAAILGSGSGLAWRWHQERERTAVIRQIADRLKRIDVTDLDLAEDELKRLHFQAENAPDLTSTEREDLVNQVRAEIDKVRQDSFAQYWHERRGCYPDSD